MHVTLIYVRMVRVQSKKEKVVKSNLIKKELHSMCQQI